MIDKWVQYVREAGDVRRFHTERCVVPNTVAVHSFNVALLTLKLAGDPSAQLLKAALFHDLAERMTGDMPAPVKRASEELHVAMGKAEYSVNTEHGLHVKLTQSEKEVLKWADLLDAAYYCLEERRMGNENMGKPFSRLMEYMRKLPPHPIGNQLLNELLAEI